MRTALDKARKDPGSMKAKILAAARGLFGEYGFHGTTTRMIAEKAKIDISTLHYHWGDKRDLYEAVLLDMNRDLGRELIEVEKSIHRPPPGGTYKNRHRCDDGLPVRSSRDIESRATSVFQQDKARNDN